MNQPAPATVISWQTCLQSIRGKDIRILSRCISLVENEVSGHEELLQALPYNDTTPVIGITGPPGAGKSTLTDALIGKLVAQGKRTAVLCVDPSSPFHQGALLGDRIRMSEWYLHPDVFIRSLATRGSLGGLHPRILEISDLLKAGGFDYILIETVGVGQSEIEIAGLADTTLVVLVPEGGDEIQTMKSGLMEIGDIFVVNKSDRPGADLFLRNLRLMLSPAFHRPGLQPAIIATVASKRQGLDELMEKIEEHLRQHRMDSGKYRLLAERAYHLIRERRMKAISKNELLEQIGKEFTKGEFNLYRFVAGYV
ncbi:MAG TPA: methylmalonyl Co-A mutase-associated GTPase MeaB [Puia sp.]|nr:methylmalonyl Co-A mutase-associated GTPase MeaB [Puia sp.]